jgi:plasmid maintenance system antidote protein VapI
MKVRPSEKFLLLVRQVHGSVNAAAEKWHVHPAILYRFIDGDSTMTLDTAAQISHKTGVSLDELFVIEPEKASKR